MPAIHRLFEDDSELSFRVYYDLMSRRVNEILLVSSPYDAFIMEEDKPLTERILDEYGGLNLTRAPRLTWVSNAGEALNALSRKPFDLVLTMPRLDDMDAYLFGKTVKQQYPGISVFLLIHGAPSLFSDPKYADKSAIDKIFVWTGNTYLLLAMVKSVEDRMNVWADTQRAKVRVILLVEDSPVYCSSILPMLYTEVVTQTRRVMEESVNEEHRILKMRARPKILTAETYEEAENLYRQFKPYILSVVSDVRFPRNGVIDNCAGFSLLSMIREESPDMPLLMLSSEEANRQNALRIPAVFLNKNSPMLLTEIREFLVQYLGFGDFTFRTPDGAEVAKASDIRAMEKILPQIPDESIYYHATRNHFSSWLMARAEIQLALKLKPIRAAEFSSAQEIRDFLVSCLRERRKRRQRGIVTQFSGDHFDTDADFVKIGKGSLGGKARGLAFISNLLKQNHFGLQQKFETVSVYVPRTLVISTDGFDAMVSANRLKEMISCGCSDDRIAELFLSSEFPPELRRNLEVFLSQVHCPLAVRSSSLLEDAQFQACAGMYKTYMIPNNHPDIGVRISHLMDAVKLVYASTFMEKPVSFAARSLRTEEEKMSVIIQQLTGKQYGTYFYPAMSGVAQSYNFYPIAHIKPEQGMVHLALGLGRIVVEGGSCLRFSPAYPQFLPQFSTVGDILSHAQRFFYALKMTDYPMRLTHQEDATLIRLEASDSGVCDHLPLKVLCSAYIPEENRIRDTVIASGATSGTYPIITFARVLKYGLFPIGELITQLLEMGRKGMGCPVEIEFAINLSEPPSMDRLAAEFALLQIRPMALNQQNADVEISEDDIRRAVCFSGRALGNGIIEDIRDTVLVKPDAFDPSKTIDIAAQISRINRELVQERRKYLLIGPGRWGSADRWLGIPVTWNDISGVSAMVEMSIEQLRADPSQGTHFFNNIISLGIPYLTISDNSSDWLNREWLNSLSAASETIYLKHVRHDPPIIIKADGKRSRAVIIDRFER